MPSWAYSSASATSSPARSSPLATACWVRLRVRMVWTRRCWAPSCRSRTTRRRASSLAVTTRPREATTSARASALAPAVATSSVKSAICDSVSGGNGTSRVVEAAITPHIRPPTTIGQPTEERMPSDCASWAIGPVAPANDCTRAGAPVSSTRAAMLSPSSVKRIPTPAHPGRVSTPRPPTRCHRARSARGARGRRRTAARSRA